MATNVYECMFILDSNRYARDVGSVTGRIPEMVEQCGGEVLADRLWSEQKLAYPIEGHRKGVYWLTYFRMESGKISDFNRACQLNDSVLRSLVLRVEPRLVDTLVAHARGESASLPEEDKAEEPAKPEPETAAVAAGDAEPPKEAAVDVAETSPEPPAPAE